MNKEFNRGHQRTIGTLYRHSGRHQKNLQYIHHSSSSFHFFVRLKFIIIVVVDRCGQKVSDEAWVGLGVRVGVSKGMGMGGCGS